MVGRALLQALRLRTNHFEFLNEAKRRFHGERFEPICKSWDAGAQREDARRREFCQMKPDRTVFFETYLVDQHRSHLAKIKRGRVNAA